MLARVIEDRAELDRYRAAIPDAQITVCRLVAAESLRVARLRAGMPPGPSRDWHERRTVELEATLGRATVEDFAVANDDRPTRQVALDVLDRAGWL